MSTAFAPDVQARFWAKVRKTKTCWLWTAYTSEGGYGLFWDGVRDVGAHRFAYEMLVGPIPKGLQIDHVRARGCTNRHCVNPEHLEPVTAGENIRRGDTGKFHRDKTRCPRGHPYDGDNLCIRQGKRYCRECKRASDLRCYHRRKASR